MPKFNMVLSDLNVRVEHEYDYLIKFCKDYITKTDQPQIVATANKLTVLKEKAMVPSAPIQVCESLCVYRAIAEKLPYFSRFVFHGAAIEYEGNAYLFTAPSGTGKTTHINLWKQYLGDKVDIINGDKPIIKSGKNPIVYGTPWAGKEGYQRNAFAPIKAICILKRGKTNNITQLDKAQAVSHLMRQVYLPQDTDALSKTLELIGAVIENVCVYMLECDISEEAFKTSYNKMTK